MRDLTPIVVPVDFYASIVWIVKLVVENRTRRLAIEKGLGGPDLSCLLGEGPAQVALRWAFVLIGVGLGLGGYAPWRLMK
ncbi:MAG: hypothetical protein ACUVTG_15765 [Candidatus Oleimicrobiaceae bacterium]